MVVHTHNPRYFGGQEDYSASLAQAKKFLRPHLNKVGIVALTCHPSYTGDIGKIAVWGWPGQKQDPT
jgi:hypothetical protein